MFAALHLPSGAVGTLDQLVACVRIFTPVWEETDSRTVVFAAAALRRLYSSAPALLQAIEQAAAEQGIAPCVVLAANADTASFGAQLSARSCIVPEGSEAKFFADLPLTAFASTPELQQILHSWGVHRCRDLARLPENALLERLGAGAVQLRRLIAGETDRLLIPSRQPHRFAAALALEDAVENLESLGFLLARLLGEVFDQLQQQGVALVQLDLHLALADRSSFRRTLQLPFPMRDRRALLKLLQLDLESGPPPAAVTDIRIDAHPAPVRTLQSGLFLPPSPEPQKLELTLARIAALVGAQNLGRVELVNTHRPDAFLLRKFTAEPQPSQQAAAEIVIALRNFRPPRPALVRQQRQRPAWLKAEGVESDVLFCTGPWRLSGDWWTDQPYRREEWDVAVADGTIYRLYQSPPRWYLDGYYD